MIKEFQIRTYEEVKIHGIPKEILDILSRKTGVAIDKYQDTRWIKWEDEGKEVTFFEEK